MADLIRTMLSNCPVPVREFFNNTVSILSKTTAQAIGATSLAMSHHNVVPKYRFRHCMPFHSRCGHRQQEDYVVLALAFLFTVLAFFALMCIGSIISYTTPYPIHSKTTRLHALERAIARQIEMNYYLSRPSQNLGLNNPNRNTANFEQWALHWSEIKRFREQAEADFKHGVPNWYYDNHPDFERRYHELRNELARLHSLGRNVVNAREEARRYCRSAVDEGDITVGDEGRARRNIDVLKAAQVNETDTGMRSGHGKMKISQGKAVFQQQLDTTGRLTPGGRFG